MALKLTRFAKLFLTAVILAVIVGAFYLWGPKLSVSESKTLTELDLDENAVNNVASAAELPLPGKSKSKEVSDVPLVRMAGYAWNGQSALIVANGGPRTTTGSLMESKGVNLEIIRQDWLSDLRNLQMKFIEELDSGDEFPREGVCAVIIMGDGAPFYISTTQQAIKDKYGDKYHIQAIGAVGLSYGEDKLIAEQKVKHNPQIMKGMLISTVLGDGDWVTTVNYAFANGIKVNPDPTTYDAEAVNILPSQDDDYMNSAKELIKSQKEGWTVPLKEVKNGKLTGKTINKTVDGCATWTPGDKAVFDALSGFTDIVSTREFPNQMATTIIIVKEWALDNVELVSNVLGASYLAANQMKQYDSWRRKAAECVYETFEIEDADYWYKMFQGQKETKDGVTYNIGGTRVFTYADAKQYYGLGGDGIKRYKAVYDQVSTYLRELNPGGFNSTVKEIVPYESAVNMLFINNLSGMEEGAKFVSTYTEEATEIVASGEWQINFATASANLKLDDLKTKSNLHSIYNLLIQAEQTKLEIVGHTDSDGEDAVNLQLSTARAESVVEYLERAGISKDRFQVVEGRGESEPIAPNTTSQGRAKNRRVEITLLTAK